MFDENNRMPFDFPSPTSCIIKVIGVGGGGGNAVNHMYKEGIHDVAFVVCNTDSKALEQSPVPTKLQLGHEGLGAGNRPEKGREATKESLEEIQNMLNDGTKMVFITAGMGGGTGTGAAPLIAKVAKDMDILTVGIVTIPFRWEGHKKIDQALDGVEEISKNVDALLVINNEKLREIYSDLSVRTAFAKANDTLLIAAKSIAEIITMRGIINLDFNDVKTVLKDGGVAIMSTGYGEGENRVTTAINEAQHSPLLNNNDIFKSQKVLLNIAYSSEHELMMNEMEEVHEFMSKFNSEFETKFGMAIDDSLGTQVKITLLATIISLCANSVWAKSNELDTINFRLTRIEDSLNEMKGLMTELRLQARDISDLRASVTECKNAINAHDKRIRIVEQMPAEKAASKWNYIADYIWKFIIAGIVLYIATKAGFPIGGGA